MLALGDLLRAMPTYDEIVAQLAETQRQLASRDRDLAVRDDQIGRLLVLVEKLNGKLDAALRLLEKRDPVRAQTEAAEVAKDLAALPPKPEGAREPPKPPPPPDPSTRTKKRHDHGRKTQHPAALTDEVSAARPARCEACKGERLRVVDQVVQSAWHYVRGTWRYRRTSRETCQCQDCLARTTASAPLPPFPRASCSTEGAAQVICAKFSQHLPVDRQARELRLQGIPIAKSTMLGWLGALAKTLQPLCDFLWRSVLAAERINLDGTGLLVLQGRGRAHRGQVYVFATDTIAVFKYFQTKHAERLSTALADFGGAAVADAASNHDELFASGERVEAGCNAHALRKFAVARDADPDIAPEGVRWLQSIYEQEALAREHSLAGQDLADFRQARIAPLLADFRTWLDLRVHETIPGTPTYKAIRYYLRHWDALTRFAHDATLPIDNNLAERLLKVVALGRKNMVFAGAEVGAERACTFYTVIETAKLAGADPHAYLVWLLNQLATRREVRGIPISELTPWRYQQLLKERDAKPARGP